MVYTREDAAFDAWVTGNWGEDSIEEEDDMRTHEDGVNKTVEFDVRTLGDLRKAIQQIGPEWDDVRILIEADTGWEVGNAEELRLHTSGWKGQFHNVVIADYHIDHEGRS